METLPSIDALWLELENKAPGLKTEDRFCLAENLIPFKFQEGDLIAVVYDRKFIPGIFIKRDMDTGLNLHYIDLSYHTLRKVAIQGRRPTVGYITSHVNQRILPLSIDSLNKKWLDVYLVVLRELFPRHPLVDAHLDAPEPQEATESLSESVVGVTPETQSESLDEPDSFRME